MGMVRANAVGFVLVSLMTLGCVGRRCEIWDDEYRGVVASAEANAAPGDGEIARRVLETTRSLWKSWPAYADIREIVKKEGENVRSAVRVEIGVAGSDTYGCVWILECRDRIVALSVRDSRLRRADIAETSWKEYKKFLADVSALDLDSRVKLTADDSAAFFVSLCLSGRSAQFGVYGILRFADMDEPRGPFDEATRRHRAVIMRTFKLVEDAIGGGACRAPGAP